MDGTSLAVLPRRRRPVDGHAPRPRPAAPGGPQRHPVGALRHRARTLDVASAPDRHLADHAARGHLVKAISPSTVIGLRDALTAEARVNTGPATGDAVLACKPRQSDRERRAAHVFIVPEAVVSTTSSTWSPLPRPEVAGFSRLRSELGGVVTQTTSPRRPRLDRRARPAPRRDPGVLRRRPRGARATGHPRVSPRDEALRLLGHLPGALASPRSVGRLRIRASARTTR
jgi:hypothetical protein